jgi:hypothetical protein
MDAALKQMLSLRQASHIEMAALKNSGLGHRDLGKTAGTLRHNAGRAARVERFHYCFLLFLKRIILDSRTPFHFDSVAGAHVQTGCADSQWTRAEPVLNFL